MSAAVIRGAATRRQEALNLAEDLVSAIELGNISPRDAALRASRLARLVDDVPALAWLEYEIRGYPTPLDRDAALAATRSGRETTGEEGQRAFLTAPLGVLASDARLGDQVSLTGGVANGDWAYRVELDRRAERNQLRQAARSAQQLLDSIVGQIHSYASAKYQELRFGAAAESAFELLRSEVDQAIAELVPDALPMLSAGFENAGSHNPEHWAAAAATCRRLLKAVADALRPAGEDIKRGGRTIRMGDGNYVNRLVSWIESNSSSATTADVVSADLAYLGHRLDAIDDAGQKGAHASVSQLEASRFITGTYLVLGDVLRLHLLHPAESDTPVATSAEV